LWLTARMPASTRQGAPRATLTDFEHETFESDGFAHSVYRKGHGPAVLVIAELPGITPQVLGFAERLVTLGCTAIVPHLFGVLGEDPLDAGKLRGTVRSLGVLTRVCISSEFTKLALGRSSPVVSWLRSLAAHEHARCGGPGVGVVGMCFTGGFALALASDARVLAPVLAQPSLPFPVSKRHRYNIDCEPEELARVANRCANEGLRVLGLRFKGDPLVPGDRFRYLKEKLGEGFVAVELPAASRHPNGPTPHPHSVLTGDLIDEPGEPTRAALDQVLSLFRDKLLGPVTHIHA
jgi:dienelactone hydrolase